MSDVAVDYVRVAVRVKFFDSRSYGFEIFEQLISYQTNEHDEAISHNCVRVVSHLHCPGQSHCLSRGLPQSFTGWQ